MKVVSSQPVVLAMTIALGAAFSMAMGTAAKIEAKSGTIAAHLPMFVIGTAAAWLGLMVVRKLLVREGYNRD